MRRRREKICCVLLKSDQNVAKTPPLLSPDLVPKGGGFSQEYELMYKLELQLHATAISIRAVQHTITISKLSISQSWSDTAVSILLWWQSDLARYLRNSFLCTNSDLNSLCLYDYTKEMYCLSHYKGK